MKFEQLRSEVESRDESSDHWKLLDAKAGIKELKMKFAQQRSEIQARDESSEEKREEIQKELMELRREEEKQIDAAREQEKRDTIQIELMDLRREEEKQIDAARTRRTDTEFGARHLDGSYKPVVQANLAVEESKESVLEKMRVTEKHTGKTCYCQSCSSSTPLTTCVRSSTDTWAWAVTVLQMHTGCKPRRHEEVLESFRRYETFMEAVILQGALDWKPDQVAEHLSPILDAKIRESRLRGEVEIADVLGILQKALVDRSGDFPICVPALGVSQHRNICQIL